MDLLLTYSYRFSHMDLLLETTPEHPHKVKAPPDVRRFPSTCITIPKDSYEQEMLKCLYILIGLRMWTSSSRRLPSTLTE